MKISDDHGPVERTGGTGGNSLRQPAKAASKWDMGFIVLILLVIVFAVLAAIGDVIAPHDPLQISLPKNRLPPFWQERGSMVHPLGTDALGRDLLSRLICGARISLYVGFMSVSMGGILGAFIGLISAHAGGKVDAFIMRTADANLAFPAILLALLLAVSLEPSTTTVIVAISVTLWPRYARVIRGEALAVMQREFVAAAKVCGSSSFRIVLTHLFPNTLNTLLVLLTLQIGWAIIVESSLSFLGAGIPPPTPSWGNIVAEGREYLTSAWWICVFPGIAICLVVMVFNFLGDRLRDMLDPKLRQI